MQINILTIGKPDAVFQKVIEYYEKKCRNYYRVNLIQLRDSKVKDIPVKMKEEENSLLKSLPRGYQCILDERGVQFDTLQFAEFIKNHVEHSIDLNFIIGGAYGLGQAVKDTADKIIRLSDFTLQHDVAYTVLLEQIYRAFTLIKNVPYHK